MRWGFCGAGLISHDFLNAMSIVSSNNKAVAIGARSQERAKALADTFGIPRAYGSYEEVADDPEVDVVYVGVINPYHKDVASMCLKKGKHVLCETPMTMNSKDTKALVEEARQAKLFLMEGYWSRSFPVYSRIREIVESGEIGEIQKVEASFKVALMDNDIKERGEGALLSIGCYTVQVAQWIIRDPPETVSATGEYFETGLDKSVEVELTYPGGRRAILHVNTVADGDTDLSVIGTKGKIQIPTGFWNPHQMILPDGSSECHPLPEGAPRKFNYPDSEGFVYEIEHVRECIEKGLTESPKMMLNDSILLSETNDLILSKLDVSF